MDCDAFVHLRGFLSREEQELLADAVVQLASSRKPRSFDGYTKLFSLLVDAYLAPGMISLLTGVWTEVTMAVRA